ncbi:L,D-transpeptidase [Halalkalibacter nanhaiisediminis]|uniref:L,D-transpeptidase-like protein n=1 Tax=Halalkalibacter nanhaiisediminis TaxID=688079 RepID=A0A562QMA4_9BACI|nr:L,D-transpeptidase [Halalkalibacter nanhaiisediminis]TWI57869.1 L,D-transpeptidase-like protein [Halalkalibacter nanhaiisediminis]
MKIALLSFLSLLIASPIWPLGENPTPGDPFIIVNVASHELAVIQDGDIKEVMRVATGKLGDETPLGTFMITVKAINPYYRKKNIPGGDPANPLGTRWIGFDANETEGRTYGIHGTNRPESIGYAVTAGCIRLPNESVERLFNEVPLGTRVHITNQNHSFEMIAREFGAIH